MQIASSVITYAIERPPRILGKWLKSGSWLSVLDAEEATVRPSCLYRDMMSVLKGRNTDEFALALRTIPAHFFFDRFHHTYIGKSSNALALRRLSGPSSCHASG